MSELIFKCLQCSKSLATDRRVSGKTCKCTDCQSIITVPEAGLEFSCPSCNHELCAPAELAGESLSCPACCFSFSLPPLESVEQDEIASRSVPASIVQWLESGEGFRLCCPACEQHLEVLADLAGQQINCPSCNVVITLPAQEAVSTPPRAQPLREIKACPFCGEEILLSAIKCKHCGEFLDGRNRHTLAASRRAHPMYLLKKVKRPMRPSKKT